MAAQQTGGLIKTSARAEALDFPCMPEFASVVATGCQRRPAYGVIFGGSETSGWRRQRAAGLNGGEVLQTG